MNRSGKMNVFTTLSVGCCCGCFIVVVVVVGGGGGGGGGGFSFFLAQLSFVGRIACDFFLDYFFHPSTHIRLI